MKFKAMMLSFSLLAMIAVIGYSPTPVHAQVDVTVGGSSAADKFNDNAVEDMCGGPGTFVRKTRTGSTGNNCPAGTSAKIRSYECNLTFCVGGSRNGLACSNPLDTCPGGTCTDGPIAATIRISGFGSAFGVTPINGNCSDPSADFLCQNSRLRVLDPSNCNINSGGNDDCACLDPIAANAVTELDLGAADVQGGSFPTPLPQPGNSASPVAVPFKFIVNSSLTAGICNAPGNINNARNCDTDADCGGAVGSCVDTRLPRLSEAEAQGIWAAGIAEWSQICWNPDTFTCSGGTNEAQPCDPDADVATECPKTNPADPQPTCDSCTAFGPARPITVFPRVVTSGTRACQTQVVHANNGLPFVGGAGNNVDVYYPSNIIGQDLGQAGCTDNEVTLTSYPWTTSPGSDGLCDECPDLNGDLLCDIRFREGESTGDVVTNVKAVDYSIGVVGADRIDPLFYSPAFDEAKHSRKAMQNGAAKLWCAETYNKRPDNTYDANTLKVVNSIIDRVGNARVVDETGSVFSGEPDMKVFKNLDRGPIQFK